MTYPQAPSSVDLTFEFPATSGGPTAVDLTFGATLGPPPGTVYVASMSGKFALRGSVTINYNVGVWRGMSSSTTVPHQQAIHQPQDVEGAWSPAVPGAVPCAATFGDGEDFTTLHGAAWAAPLKAHSAPAATWGDAAPNNALASNQWQGSTKAHNNAASRWQGAAHLARGNGVRYGHGKPTPLSNDIPWQQGKAHQHAVTSRLNQAAKAMKPFAVIPWQQALVLASYGGPQYLAPPRPTDPVVPPVVIDLRFCALYPDSDRTTLIFGLNPCGGVTPDSPLYVLPARFYMAVHSVEAYLLPGNMQIPIFDLQLSADVGSTSWAFSATTVFSSFDELMPIGGVPRLVRVVVDGLEWVFAVDGLAQSEAFGSKRAKLSGRSQVAMLGEPYRRKVHRLSATSRTAQQLAADTLQPAEVGAGWGLDWGLTDWLVPAGAWSDTGTPLASIQAIANSVGGYVNAHRTDKTVLVRHPYPLLPGGIPGGPWNWEGAAGAFSADVELAPDVILSRSVERTDGADLDGVYVAGTVAGGIEAFVKRSGTIGSKLAPMVTNPLITATAAATQLGFAVLGAGGNKHKVQITMPVLVGGSNPGVLDVGQLVQVNDSTPWRGRVRSVNVNFSKPTLRQQVTLERHMV